MEPTIAPMMMLVTVIPETEEEEGSQECVNQMPVARPVSHTNTREFTNHKQAGSGHINQQEKSSRRRREEGRVTLLPRQRDSEEERWALIQGNSNNIQKKLTEMS